MVKCMCKGCKARHVGCHSECSSYQAYTEYRREILEEKHKTCITCADMIGIMHVRPKQRAFDC